jgi:hypothetical protein
MCEVLLELFAQQTVFSRPQRIYSVHSIRSINTLRGSDPVLTVAKEGLRGRSPLTQHH